MLDVRGSGCFQVNCLVVVAKWARSVTVPKWTRCYVAALAAVVPPVATCLPHADRREDAA